jgi:MFS transporter, putative metabolite:H+ symporter
MLQHHDSGMPRASSSDLGTFLDNLPLNKRHFVVLGLCSAGFLFDGVDAQIIAFVAPVLSKEWDLQPQVIGSVLSATLVGMIVGAYSFGIASDYIGRRTGFQLTVAFFGVFTGICALVTNVFQLAAARFGVGIGVGGFPAVDATVLNEFMPAKHRGKMTSWSVVFFPVGGLVAAWLASIIIPTYGWRALFLIGAAPSILVLGLRWILPETPRFLLQKGRLRDARESINWIALNKAPHISLDSAPATAKSEKISVIELFSRTYLRRTIMISVMWATWNFTYYGLLLWLPIILTKYKAIPTERMYPFMMAFLASGIFGRIVASYLLDVIGRKVVMGACGLLGGLFVFLFGLQTDFYYLLIFGLLVAPFHDAMGGCLVAYNGELYPTRVRTTGVGWGSGVGRIGSSLAPVTVGFLIPHSQLGVFAIFAGCYLIYGLVMIFFGEETRGMPLDEAALETR